MNKQYEIDKHYIKHAQVVAERSKCVKYQVGCVIVRNDRIISTGYNGTPPGFMNCNFVFNSESFDREAHRIWAKAVEIHAEQNAIGILAKHGISADGATCYVTLQPCQSCLLLLVASGIKRVVYLMDKIEYDNGTQKMLRDLNISITKLI